MVVTAILVDYSIGGSDFNLIFFAKNVDHRSSPSGSGVTHEKNVTLIQWHDLSKEPISRLSTDSHGKVPMPS